MSAQLLWKRPTQYTGTPQLVTRLAVEEARVKRVYLWRRGAMRCVTVASSIDGRNYLKPGNPRTAAQYNLSLPCSNGHRCCVIASCGGSCEYLWIVKTSAHVPHGNTSPSHLFNEYQVEVAPRPPPRWWHTQHDPLHIHAHAFTDASRKGGETSSLPKTRPAPPGS